tara:strand:- start:2500 stop:2613 length:114 start_codon:yes stop_codon:yes gene_type:complete
VKNVDAVTIVMKTAKVVQMMFAQVVDVSIVNEDKRFS